MSFSPKRCVLAITLTTLASVCAFAQVTVEPVPWDPTNFSSPHTVITGQAALLTATVNLGGSTDAFTYSWNFGDGSGATAPASVTNLGNSTVVGDINNLSVSHTYTAVAGTTYTAVITVTDTTSSTNYTGDYYVIVQANTLSSRVNVAIDNGLWFEHTTMERGTTTNANSVVVPWGGWDGGIQGCRNSYDCLDTGGFDATMVQAFEVSGHLPTGPSNDPYTTDVVLGINRMLYFMKTYANSGNPTTGGGDVPKTIGYNPALMAARCSDGTQPNYAAQTCATGTYINYNPGATSCTAPPCTFVFDGNSNGQMIIEGNDSLGDPGYQSGMLVTALVASGNPAGVAQTGVAGGAGLPGILGQTYQNIVQDLVDGVGHCQYYADDESSSGYENGGGWEYYCAGTIDEAEYYDDNSISQWNAIALVAANRGFGISIPPIITDTNQVWITWDQDTTSASKGQYGYDEWNDQVWGPFAVTPSGLVQMAMDQVGRTLAGNSDQRWNLTESYYHDNFCNAGTNAITAPKAYTYGLFSFTKAMEQHDPGGVLTPITFLEDQPSGKNPIDWYNAQAANGDPCDGVAQTLVARQNYSGYTGLWYGQDYYYYQYFFDTPWSIIMLQKTSFIACVTNLGGAAKAGGRSLPEATLSWSGIGTASSYNVQRSTTNGGPYSTVGNTTSTDFVDQSKSYPLTNGDTYYYVLQPLNAGGAAICTSNQAIIAVP